MYSSEDLERFYFQYKTEALPQGISIESFCLKNKVPYNIFSKWYRDTRKGIVEVHVDGRPDTSSPQVPEAASSEEAKPRQEKTRIKVEIRMTNGLYLSQKNLSYKELVILVGKLEGLC